MSASSPPLVAPSPVPARPAAPLPPVAAPPPPLPRTGEIVERGTARHESVRAALWATEGTAKVVGDVDVDRADLKGFVTIGGTLRADRVLVRGELEVVGDAAARGAFEVRGQCRAQGAVSAGDAGFDGTVILASGLRVERLLQNRGRLEVAGPVHAGFFDSHGRFDLRGDLDAPRVHATLVGASHVGTIHSSQVRIRLPPLPPVLRDVLPKVLPMIFRGGTLDVDRIEATSVEIEGVTAQYIWADRIVVGRNCHVARYDGTIVSCHRSSHLGPESRTPPPRGMSR